MSVLLILRQWWWLVLYVILALAIAGLLADRTQRRAELEATRSDRDTAMASVTVLQTQLAANETAAIERMADQTKIQTAKDEVINAIQKTPDAAPVAGGPRLALLCMRWKAQHPGKAAPTPCR